MIKKGFNNFEPSSFFLTGYELYLLRSLMTIIFVKNLGGIFALLKNLNMIIGSKKSKIFAIILLVSLALSKVL